MSPGRKRARAEAEREAAAAGDARDGAAPAEAAADAQPAKEGSARKRGGKGRRGGKGKGSNGDEAPQPSVLARVVTLVAPAAERATPRRRSGGQAAPGAELARRALAQAADKGGDPAPALRSEVAAPAKRHAPEPAGKKKAEQPREPPKAAPSRLPITSRITWP